MKESEYRRQLKKSLDYWGGANTYAISFPSMFIQGGVSDLVCCIKGYFVAIECKHIEEVGDNLNINYLKYGFTALQLNRAKQVLSAHGYAFGMINCWNLRKTVIVRLPYDPLASTFAINKKTIETFPTFDYNSFLKVWELGAFIKSI